jgi:ABC-2 type transport system ATP-binding protein
LLVVENLTKTYGKFIALSDVSFTVDDGESVLLIGPNGAGKTTIIKSILGLLYYSGKISVDSNDMARHGASARAKVGYVPQQLTFGYNTSIQEQARFMSALRGGSNDDGDDALRQASLWEIKKRKVNSLSHGMRQKMGLALALVKDPPLLIFDEPINNVDLEGQLEFRSTIEGLSKKGKTILVATHLSGLSEIVGKAIVLQRGKVIATGTPRELLARMNAADTVYLRVDEEQIPKVMALVEATIGREARKSNEWIVFSVPPDMKAEVVVEVTSAGYKIKDMIIEPSSIESQYVKLFNQATTP